MRPGRAPAGHGLLKALLLCGLAQTARAAEEPRDGLLRIPATAPTGGAPLDWILRRVPIFGVPGSGDYRVQPVSVEDVADLAVSAGVRGDNIVQDAVGPEDFSFKELIRMISTAIGGRARIISVPPAVGMLSVALIGRLVDDVVLTAEELQGLMANLLVSSGQSTGRRRFSDWLAEHAGSLGLRYAHELNRHYRSVARSQHLV